MIILIKLITELKKTGWYLGIKKGVINMDAEDRRMNQFIDFVNANKSKSELIPPIQNEYENELFDKLEK